LIPEKGDVKWSFYCKQDDIDKLINSLNERGIRESELKQSLCDFKHKIMQGLSKCPVKHLSMNENDINSIVSNMTPSIKGHLLVANEQLEADFRQKLLDIEEQINAGSLGSLKVLFLSLKKNGPVRTGSFSVWIGPNRINEFIERIEIFS
jgi:bromodomain adjacent to zinc finger domain protein 1A